MPTCPECKTPYLNEHLCLSRATSGATAERYRRSRENARERILQQLELQRGLCGLCGKHVVLEQASWDHIIPRAHGGTSDATNLQLAHRLCNGLKGDSLYWPTWQEWLNGTARQLAPPEPSGRRTYSRHIHVHASAAAPPPVRFRRLPPRGKRPGRFGMPRSRRRQCAPAEDSFEALKLR